MPSRPVVSAVASDRFLVPSPSGRFNTAVYYYTSFVEQDIALIARISSTGTDVHQQLYTKHIDDKRDHLMVDDELNFTGLIDWQMASVVAADEAFGPLVGDGRFMILH